MPGGSQRWSIAIKETKCYVYVDGSPLSKKNVAFLNLKAAKVEELKGQTVIKVTINISFIF